MNLALYLANATTPVSAEEIRTEVIGYSADQADDAFKRQFERDKDDLRASGFVILTDPENEGYYHLDRSATFARPLDLTPQEAAAVRAAASALVDDPSFPFTEDLRLAIAKISSAVESGDVPAAARLADEDPDQQGAVVAELVAAAGACKSVEFGYTNSHGISAPHEVEPYGLFLHDGRWYLVGRDIAKDEERTYTVARMSDIAVNRARPKYARLRAAGGLRRGAVRPAPVPVRQAGSRVHGHHRLRRSRGLAGTVTLGGPRQPRAHRRRRDVDASRQAHDRA